MTTSSTPPSSSSSTSASNSSDGFSPTEWTQQGMLSDLMQQKGLLIGIGVVVLGLLLMRARSSKRPEEKAVRRLVRDWRKVDDVDGARDLLGSSLPAILRPVLMIALEEIERQVELGFRKAEREIGRL